MAIWLALKMKCDRRGTSNFQGEALRANVLFQHIPFPLFASHGNIKLETPSAWFHEIEKSPCPQTSSDGHERGGGGLGGAEINSHKVFTDILACLLLQHSLSDPD